MLVRKHVVRAFTGAAAVCLVWNFVARPMEGRLAVQQVAYASTIRAISEFEASESGTADVGPVITAMKARRDAIYAWTSKSGDMTRLYEAMRRIASQHKVRIERIEPTAVRASGPRPDAGSKDPSAEVFGYTVELTGTYEAVASFAAACDSQLGATKVVNVRIAAAGPSAAGAAATVSAVVETMHLKLVPRLAPDAKPPAAKPTAGGKP
jgi:hypothetical protein